MKAKRIFAVHLLNDFSGSPLILRQSLEILSNDHEVHLYTSTPSGEGNLSNIPGVINHDSFYKWSPNKLLTLFYFITAQSLLFFRFLFILKKEDTVYVNTLLPFGAALAGWIIGARVIYHIHEVSITPALLKSFLVKIARLCSAKIIFVSNFVKTQFDFPDEKSSVIYNALPTSFVKEAMSTVAPGKHTLFTVLMLASLKAYKGIYEFVEIAKCLPDIQFVLVLNSSQSKVDAFQKSTDAPTNCTIYPVQNDTAPFYKKANVVVNLSHPDRWMETFGMTILEGMYYGLPAIVPPVGGVTELVRDGIEGIYAGSRDINNVIDAIVHLHTDNAHYNKIALAAWFRAQHFSQQTFKKHIDSLFNIPCTSFDQVPALEI